jgi:hypothetical protein
MSEDTEPDEGATSRGADGVIDAVVIESGAGRSSAGTSLERGRSRGNEDASAADGGPRSGRTSSRFGFDWKVFTVLAVAIVLIAAIVSLLVTAGEDDAPAPTATPSPVSSGGTPSTVVVATDDFDRPNDPRSMGVAPTGQPWRTVNGIWGVIDGTAYLVEASPDAPRNFSLLDTGSGDGSVSARIDRTCPGWGMVFRYVGPYNWWSIQAQPEFATYNVVKFIDGTENLVARLSPVPTSDGTEIRVDYAGAVIRVYADGEQVGVIQDSHALGGETVGLVANQPCTDAGRWDDFQASAAEE